MASAFFKIINASLPYNAKNKATAINSNEDPWPNQKMG